MSSVNKVKKIIYFLDFPYGTGGSSRVLLTQASIMKTRGYDATIVIPNDEEGMHISLYDELCTEYNLRLLTALYPISTCMEEIDILEVFKRYSGILGLLTRERPDLIHSVQMNVTVELAARELGIPHLMNIYPTDLETFNINWMDVYPHYHSADSELFVKRWGEGLDIAARCIRIAYKSNCRREIKNGEDIFAPIQILIVGVLAEHKNQLAVLKFMTICKKEKRNITLTILGEYDNSYGEKCVEYVRQNDLEKQVIFRGFVKNVEDYFAQADLMILSSTMESYPGVIVESMANKVPIITTPIAGIQELLRDGSNCFLTNGYRGEDIYEAFERYLLYRKSGRIEEIIKCAYECYLRYHSYEAIGEQLELYYDWIKENYDAENSCVQEVYVRCQIERFVQKRYEKGVNPFTESHIWFLYHIYKIGNSVPFQKIIIWGAGFFGEIALEWLEFLGYKDKLMGYIDTHKQGTYLGYPILEDEEQAIKASDMILLAIGDVKSCLENMRKLEQFGKKRNKDYFLVLNAPIRM